MWMDLPEPRTEDIQLWVVASCRLQLHAIFGRIMRVCVLKSVCLFSSHSGNVGSVYSLGNLITECSALVQFVLSFEYNFTNYYCNTYFNAYFNTKTSLHFASALSLVNVLRVKLVINSDYFLKPCWLDLCNGDVICFLWGRIQIFTFNLLVGVFQGSEIWAAAVSVVCASLFIAVYLFIHTVILWWRRRHGQLNFSTTIFILMRRLNFQVTAGNNVTQSVEARAKLYSVNCTSVGMSFVFFHGACSKWEFLVSYYNQDGSFTWNNVHAARTVFRTVTAVIVELLHTHVFLLASCLVVIHQRTVLTEVLQYIVLVILDLRVLLWVGVT